MWAPDVYEGATNPITFILATIAKIGFFCGFIQLIVMKLCTLFSISQTLLILSIVGSLITGAYGGLRQENIKRFLAFTSMHHIGFIFSSLICEASIVGIQYSFIYLTVYITGLAGFFSIFLLIHTTCGNNMTFFTDLVLNAQATTSFSNVFGLISLIIYLLSMAGIPPFAGFFGKYIIFLIMTKKHYITLFIVSLMTSFMSIFNYLRIIKIILLTKIDFNIISTTNKFQLKFI
jgi:NADH-quinone oxidoreductase subunit N